MSLKGFKQKGSAGIKLLNPLYKLQIDKKVRGAVFWGFFLCSY